MPVQTPPPQNLPSTQKGKKLLDQLRDAIRAKHYSYRTEQTYIDWCKRYILYHNKRHPAEMGVPEIQLALAFFGRTACLYCDFVSNVNYLRRARSFHLGS